MKMMTKTCNLSLTIPEQAFIQFLDKYKWSWHQVARGEYPNGYRSLDELQLACLCNDPVLWVETFLKEPDSPSLPYQFFDYQKESIRYAGNTLHECGAEVGKTREIVAFVLWKAFTVANGSGLISAPMYAHVIEIVDAIEEQFGYNKELKKSLVQHRKHPHHMMRISNGFKIFFRPTGHDGEALRGVHVKTFAILDEATKIKNPDVFKEFWRATKPNCSHKIYSTPDGDRSCQFFKLCQRAEGKEVKDGESDSRNLTFRKFQWSKALMPDPFWSASRRRFYIEQYGGEDSPGYQQNVLGIWGDPESTVFPWYQFERLLKDITEYKCLKIVFDNAQGLVSVTGTEYRPGVDEDGKKSDPREIFIIDKQVKKSQFDIKSELKTMFTNTPGLKFAGADLGFSQDPTEIIIKAVTGRVHRVIARLHLKGVTYDEQAEAIDALDDIFDNGKSDMGWGIDFGNAGSAVVHILQNQEKYFDKRYENRLTGYQFGAIYDAIDETGEVIIDKHTEKPVKLNGKELSTDLLIKKMQRQQLEYPYDPDFILFYPNHTYRMGPLHRIFKGTDDHLIDADRVLTLRVILPGVEQEDLFA
jgi:hypothetical protein